MRIAHDEAGAMIVWLRSGSWGRRALLVLAGTVFLAACSWIEVPMLPVPMTMQSFGLLVVGALYGWRLGGATVGAYLAAGAIGLPVFAGGASGLDHFIGPTAGYLFAFPVATILVGWLAERGFTHQPLASFGIMLLGHAVIVGPGVAWLAVGAGLGWEEAAAAGMTPFLPGMALKSAAAAACLHAAQRYRRPIEPDGP